MTHWFYYVGTRCWTNVGYKCDRNIGMVLVSDVGPMLALARPTTLVLRWHSMLSQHWLLIWKAITACVGDVGPILSLGCQHHHVGDQYWEHVGSTKLIHWRNDFSALHCLGNVSNWPTCWGRHYDSISFAKIDRVSYRLPIILGTPLETERLLLEFVCLFEFACFLKFYLQPTKLVFL